MMPRLAFGRQALGVVLAAAVLVTGAGCGSRRVPPPPDQASSEQSATTETADPLEQTAETEPPAGPQEGEVPPSQTVESQHPAPEQAPLESVGPEDARRGSTIRGGGIITEPLRQYFLIQHRIVFDYVKHAEQLYKAEHGQLPKTHDEYMREIIEANSLELPELDPGWEYFYDASDGELKRRKTN